MNPITVNKDLPTDTNDCLSGTALDPVPGPGLCLIYIASSQRDGILTVGGPAVMGGGGYKVPPVLRANGIPDVNSDVPYIVAVQQGKLQIDYDEVTAGDAFLTVLYLPA
jgi:hypothetical protein